MEPPVSEPMGGEATHSRRQHPALPAGTAAGNAIGIARDFAWCEGAVLPCWTHRKFVEIGFADNTARLLEFFHDRRVVGSTKIVQHRRGAGGRAVLVQRLSLRAIGIPANGPLRLP